MRYEKIKSGVFIDRPNRFIANIMMEGQTESCHVKNTGRCRELLTPGACVYVQNCEREGRKTKFDLIGVKKGDMMVNMDSQAPNKAVWEWLEKEKTENGITCIRPEKKYGNSRFDFYLEAKGHRIFMEVKGVTLEEDGVARFPDAPTQRGIKHIRELIECRKSGYEAVLLFLIQMKPVRIFRPNDDTQPEFGQALRDAREAGVVILAFDSRVTEDSIWVDQPVRIEL